MSGQVLDELERLKRDGFKFTSNIVWSESKYNVCSQVAEFWNTVSNVPLFVAGLFGFAQGLQQGVPWRYILCHVFVMCIGVGSFLFHATLTKFGQLLDEGQMLLLISQSLYCLIADSTSHKNHKLIVGIGMYLTGLVTFLIYIVLDKAIVFQGLFALMVAAAILQSMWVLRNMAERPAEGLTMGRSLIYAFGYCTAAFVVWNMDNVFCQFLRQLRAEWGFPLTVLTQGHAWWHVLNAVGLSWFIAGLLLADLAHKTCFKVERRWICIPVVTRLQSFNGDIKA